VFVTSTLVLFYGQGLNLLREWSTLRGFNSGRLWQYWLKLKDETNDEKHTSLIHPWMNYSCKQFIEHTMSNITILPDSEKHSSLPHYEKYFNCKKFYSNGPWCQSLLTKEIEIKWATSSTGNSFRSHKTFYKCNFYNSESQAGTYDCNKVYWQV